MYSSLRHAPSLCLCCPGKMPSAIIPRVHPEGRRESPNGPVTEIPEMERKIHFASYPSTLCVKYPDKDKSNRHSTNSTEREVSCPGAETNGTDVDARSHNSAENSHHKIG